jgi:hypothetical protein
MRIILTVLLISLSCSVFSQLKFPKEFKLVEGENGSGRDDIYTTGRYSFDYHNVFVDYDYKKNDDSVRKFLSTSFGFPFHLTKDGLCWGTGMDNGFYSYIIITDSGNDIELYSKYNDSLFSYYSTWLLTTVRAYKKEGKDAYFPMQVHKGIN